MAYATFTATVEMKVSLNIEGISPASWEEIQNTIFNVVEKENLLKREALKGEIVLPPMDLDKIREEIGKAPDVSAPEKPEDKYAKVLHYTNYADVIALFKDEEERPWAYEMTWLPAKVWMAKCPTLNNASLHGVSHTLGSMCANGLVQREERYNSGIKQNEILFRVPVPKTDEEEEGHVNPRDVAIGNTIRALREQHGFSPKELSDLCGYDVGTIVQWELGLYTVSSAAMEKLKDLFGKDAFQGVA